MKKEPIEGRFAVVEDLGSCDVKYDDLQPDGTRPAYGEIRGPQSVWLVDNVTGREIAISPSFAEILWKEQRNPTEAELARLKEQKGGEMKISDRQQEHDEWWDKHLMMLGRHLHHALREHGETLTVSDIQMLTRKYRDSLNAKMLTIAALGEPEGWRDEG